MCFTDPPSLVPPQPPSNYRGSRAALLTQVMKPVPSMSILKNSASITSSDMLLRLSFMVFMKVILSRASKETGKNIVYFITTHTDRSIFGCLGAEGVTQRGSHLPGYLLHHLFNIQPPYKYWLHTFHAIALCWPHCWGYGVGGTKKDQLSLFNK